MSTQQPLLREFHATNTKFGFEASLDGYNFIAMSALVTVALCGAIPNVDFKWERKEDTYRSDVKIYTDDATLAERLRVLNALPVPESATILKGVNPYAEYEQHLLASGSTLTP